MGWGYRTSAGVCVVAEKGLLGPKLLLLLSGVKRGGAAKTSTYAVFLSCVRACLVKGSSR